MTTELLFIIGACAGILQIVGYILYLRDSDIDPNPVTWFMFAYGTGILALLEWDSSATWPELFLPIACAVLSIVVSYKCWKRARAKDPTRWWPEDWWPEDKTEKLSFVSDILITLAYIAAWMLASWSILTPENREYAVLTFLFLSNLSTFPSFYPLLRETYLNPQKENWLPWAVWAVSYALLALVTYKTHGSLFHPLMFYPLSNVFLHGIASWLASREPNKILNTK
jgi:hypothetical protein